MSEALEASAAASAALSAAEGPQAVKAAWGEHSAALGEIEKIEQETRVVRAWRREDWRAVRHARDLEGDLQDSLAEASSRVKRAAARLKAWNGHAEREAQLLKEAELAEMERQRALQELDEHRAYPSIIWAVETRDRAEARARKALATE